MSAMRRLETQINKLQKEMGKSAGGSEMEGGTIAENGPGRRSCGR